MGSFIIVIIVQVHKGCLGEEWESCASGVSGISFHDEINHCTGETLLARDFKSNANFYTLVYKKAVLLIV